MRVDAGFVEIHSQVAEAYEPLEKASTECDHWILEFAQQVTVLQQVCFEALVDGWELAEDDSLVSILRRTD